MKQDRFHVLAMLVLGALAACDPTLVEPPRADLADGDYVVRLSAPIVTNDFLTPEWMRSEPTFEISKLAGTITVNATADTLIVRGPAQSVRPTTAGLQAQFSWTVLMDGDHYWEIEMSADGCTSAEAVDADLGVGPGGVFRIPLGGCVIEGR